jgi:hypothetical protein
MYPKDHSKPCFSAPSTRQSFLYKVESRLALIADFLFQILWHSLNEFAVFQHYRKNGIATNLIKIAVDEYKKGNEKPLRKILIPGEIISQILRDYNFCYNFCYM